MYILDPPHLIKAIRNNLVEYNFHIGDKIASWSDIKLLYEKDMRHQMLSKTIAKTHLTKWLTPTAHGTVDLVPNLDEIIHCLNTSPLYGPTGKSYKTAVTKDSRHVEFMNKMKKFVSSIKVVNPVNGKDVTNTTWLDA